MNKVLAKGLYKTLIRCMVIIPVALALYWCGQTNGIVGSGITGTPSSEPKPVIVSEPQAIANAHDCWTDTAPADVKFPGHVVVRVDGRLTYGGKALAGKALDQIFKGKDYGLTVYAFCR